MRPRPYWCLAAVLLLVAAAPAGAAAAAADALPAFTRKPSATREGNGVRIGFAADRPTDVAVSV